MRAFRSLTALMALAVPVIAFAACASRTPSLSASVAEAGFHSGGVTATELADWGRKALSSLEGAGESRDLSRPIRYWIHSPEPAEILVCVPIAPRRIDNYAVFHFDAATGRQKQAALRETVCTIGKLQVGSRP